MRLLPVIFILLILVSTGLTAGPNVSAQTAFLNSISGNIVDENRSPIPDLQVELLNDMESVISRTKTDSFGLFVFRRLSTGVFQVRVQTYGTTFVGQTKRVQLERTRAFEQVDFVLSRGGVSATATTGTVFVQEVPDQARKDFERGASQLKAEQRSEGIATLKKAIELFPLYFDALELLGTEYVRQQEFEAAVPVLTKAIEVNRRAYSSLYALSMAQHGIKQLPEAVESMKRAIILNPRSANANLWLGMLLRQAGKFDEAETYLKDADKLAEAKSADTKWQLALLYNQMKRPKEAADQLELFLKLQPDSKDTELIKKLIQRLRQQSASNVKP
ncbi:MAG TPA: tetratricopeptide repeat protein [Pyrinomonadaceae bacterium]|nr:tetratricopeptide repeat protein [Pyrinomonadaceae bacterium]